MRVCDHVVCAVCVVGGWARIESVVCVLAGWRLGAEGESVVCVLGGWRFGAEGCIQTHLVATRKAVKHLWRPARRCL